MDYINNSIRNANNDHIEYGDGYIYCLSNESFKENIFKVGFTKNIPQYRARQLYTTGVPTPFKIEFAKKVKSPEKKERLIHDLLDDYGYREYSSREFFKCELIEIFRIFEVIRGSWYDVDIEEEENVEEENVEEECVNIINKKLNRKLENCFINGQKIRHKSRESIWVGVYDREKNSIRFNGNYYSPNQFSLIHNKKFKPGRKTNNAWSECECETENGLWISIHDLPYI